MSENFPNLEKDSTIQEQKQQNHKLHSTQPILSLDILWSHNPWLKMKRGNIAKGMQVLKHLFSIHLTTGLRKPESSIFAVLTVTSASHKFHWDLFSYFLSCNVSMALNGQFHYFFLSKNTRRTVNLTTFLASLKIVTMWVSISSQQVLSKGVGRQPR